MSDDDDDDVADAADLFRQPAKQKQDPRQTGMLKVIDMKRQKKDKQKGGKQAPTATGAQALKALLQPAAEAGAGAGLAGWD